MKIKKQFSCITILASKSLLLRSVRQRSVIPWQTPWDDKVLLDWLKTNYAHVIQKYKSFTEKITAKLPLEEARK